MKRHHTSNLKTKTSTRDSKENNFQNVNKQEQKVLKKHAQYEEAEGE